MISEEKINLLFVYPKIKIYEKYMFWLVIRQQRVTSIVRSNFGIKQKPESGWTRFFFDDFLIIFIFLKFFKCTPPFPLKLVYLVHMYSKTI